MPNNLDFDLRTFLKKIHDESKTHVQPIQIKDQSEWTMNNGVLTHRSGGFFHPVGVMNRLNPSEEYLMYYQPQSALTGLILFRQADEVYIMLQARTEPGNVNITQYGPSIQSTASNYLRMHGGRATYYLDRFQTYVPDNQLIQQSMQLDLGKRYYLKSKFHKYIEVVNKLPETANMIWSPLSNIERLLGLDNIINTDCRSLLGIFDWDNFLYPDTTKNRKIEKYAQSFYSRYTEAVKLKIQYQMISPEKLDNWQNTEDGITSNRSDTVSVKMFACHSLSREVKSWHQPLLCAEQVGLTQLAIRNMNSNQPEILITIGNEPGISNPVVLPSFLAYPGELVDKRIIGNVITKILQSDEGGRFYRHQSTNEILEVDPNMTVNNNQIWVSIGFFKHLLQSSNMVSIQLRQLSSLILPLLNPITFS